MAGVQTNETVTGGEWATSAAARVRSWIDLRDGLPRLTDDELGQAYLSVVGAAIRRAETRTALAGEGSERWADSDTFAHDGEALRTVFGALHEEVLIRDGLNPTHPLRVDALAARAREVHPALQDPRYAAAIGLAIRAARDA